METDGHGAHNGLPPVVQRRIFFGRQVGGADRKLLPTYPLKSRKYLGPATLNAEMAFLMANQAQVTPRKVVYDPFVGSGSILIVAAHFGAITMGADIDLGQYLMVVVLTVMFGAISSSMAYYPRQLLF